MRSESTTEPRKVEKYLRIGSTNGIRKHLQKLLKELRKRDDSALLYLPLIKAEISSLCLVLETLKLDRSIELESRVEEIERRLSDGNKTVLM